jgi:hypothetical protein
MGEEISELRDGLVVKLKNNSSNGDNYLGLKGFYSGVEVLGLYNSSEKLHSFKINRNKQNISLMDF